MSGRNPAVLENLKRYCRFRQEDAEARVLSDMENFRVHRPVARWNLRVERKKGNRELIMPIPESTEHDDGHSDVDLQATDRSIE